MMTVRPSFTYFTWLPFCDLKTKPWCRRTFRICSADGSLGIHSKFAHVNVKRDRQIFGCRIFKIKIHSFFEVCRSFVISLAEAADLKIQATGNNVFAFAICYILNFLHRYCSKYSAWAERQPFFTGHAPHGGGTEV